MRSHSHLNTALSIIRQYDGRIPLAAWLKQFFRTGKKFGSSDRRSIGHAVYCYYRLGRSFSHLDEEQKLLTGVFLCSQAPVRMIDELKPEWRDSISLDMADKLQMMGASVEGERIFPFPEHLSADIEAGAFSASFLVQPDVFLRIRPGRRKAVLHQLRQADIPFMEEGEEALRLHSQAKVEEVLAINEEVVVQDINSQAVLDPVFEVLRKAPASAWDCCAASGGKSMLLHDRFPQTKLTVSDVRESILVNLEKRFRQAGISNYTSFIADLTLPHFVPGKFYELILCDAPCSGSGTWGRTPEQLHFFKEEQIAHYVRLQRSIAEQALKALAPGGWFLYSTCSVFREENEENLAHFTSQLPLRLHRSEYKKGYRHKADTLFTALFQRL